MNVEKSQRARRYELRVLIIIFCLLGSLTTRLRSVNTILIVSTTLWKLLAAPRSWVNRMMLSGCFLPCSITVITSAAKATGLRFRPVLLVSIVEGTRRQLELLTILGPDARKDDIAFLIHLYIRHAVLAPLAQQHGHLLSGALA